MNLLDSIRGLTGFSRFERLALGLTPRRDVSVIRQLGIVANDRNRWERSRRQAPNGPLNWTIELDN